ncbi:hypothetical protein [Aeromonas hydrophila]
MKNEIHVLFETLDKNKHLVRYESSHDIEYTANEPAYINFIRIIDGDWTITVDTHQTILDYKDTELRIHWMNAEPEYLVIKDKADDEAGEFTGSIVDLLRDYQIPMEQREWVGHRMTLLRTKLRLEPCKMKL